MKTKISNILFLIFIAGLILGIFQLFSLRFSSGDVYPPYSSLRSDPLGSKGLYRSLEEYSHVERIERNFQPLSWMDPQSKCTFFYIGSETSIFYDTDTYRALTGLAGSGHRVIISLYPEKLVKEEGDKDEENGDKPGDKCEQVNEEKNGVDRKDKKGDLGIGFDFQEGGVSGAARVQAPYSIMLPEQTTWYSDIYFNILSDVWRPVYEVNGLPVVVEKKTGAGSMVIMSDSFFLSNESLAEGPETAVLLWLLGENRFVVFDEWHMGIEKNIGITGLFRKYRLPGLFVCIIMCVLLTMWRKAMPLEYAMNGDYYERADDHQKSTRNYADAMAALLRRNIDERELPEFCFSRWKNSRMKHSKVSDSSIKKAEQLIREYNNQPDRNKKPADIYQKLYQILTERRVT